MTSVAIYGLIVLIFTKLFAIAASTGALAYLCYRMTQVLNKAREMSNVSSVER